MDNSTAGALVEEQDANVAEHLNQQEREMLAACEQTITANVQVFMKVGESLRLIRDSKLYRETHKTFQAYCRERWDFTRTHAYRLIGAAETMEVLSPLGDTLPTAETQVRPLLQFGLADRPQVWRDVQTRLRIGDSRCATGKINQIVQNLIQGSDDEPYRQRRKVLRRERRERLRQAEKREQRLICESHVTSRRQEAPLPDDNLTQLGNIASKLKNALVRTKDSYEAMEVPDDHVVNQMMVAIEISVARLTSWIAAQRTQDQAA